MSVLPGSPPILTIPNTGTPRAHHTSAMELEGSGDACVSERTEDRVERSYGFVFDQTEPCRRLVTKR